MSASINKAAHFLGASARSLRLASALFVSFAALAVFTVFWGGAGQPLRLFLMWNIFLAFVPLLAAFAVQYRQFRNKKWPPTLLLALLWFAMYPNAPYMLTDFMHLSIYPYTTGYDANPGFHTWLGLVHMVAAVGVGVIMGLLSLSIMQTLVRKRFGNKNSWLFAALVSLVSGIALYLGRFLRFNSWDLLRRPLYLLGQIFERPPLEIIKFSALFALLCFGSYFFFHLCFSGENNP